MEAAGRACPEKSLAERGLQRAGAPARFSIQNCIVLQHAQQYMLPETCQDKALP